MPPLMQMPAYRIDNTELQTEPVVNALMQNRAYGLKQEQMGLERERTGMDRERLNMTRQTHEEARADALKKRIGGQALIALQEPDEAKRGAVLQSILSQHPEAAKLPDHYRNPNTGLLAILGDAGMAGDYLNYQLKKQMDSRQAAAESRQEQLFPVQLESERLAVETKKRALNQPKTFDLANDHTRYQEQRNPDGTITAVPIVQGADKAPPEHVSKAANFAARMIEAERNTRALLSGVDPVSGTPRTKFGASDASVAATAALPEVVRNMTISSEHQQYRQSAEQWIRAFLRKESGAAIGKDEFARDFVVYFPQPGDKPEVVKQKEEARAAVMHGIASEGGAFFGKSNPEYKAQLDMYRAPVMSPDEAKAQPPGTMFRTSDGRLMRVPGGAR